MGGDGVLKCVLRKYVDRSCRAALRL
ncbi:hypothetical protein LUTEI9C_140113 [Luteimonas sp. 9C]|nr:hypothetical protein LUTEI9C_140113 [Luteimonas sp. 9C]